MKLVLKEIDYHPPAAQGTTPVPPVDNRYNSMGMEEECACTCPKCHRPIEPDEDGEIEGDTLEITPQILAGLLGAGTKLVVIEKRR